MRSKRPKVMAARAGTAPRATSRAGWRSSSDAPGLQVEVDYGERRFDVAQPTRGADGWSGKASDGTDVKLSFQRTTCQDDMSGEAFEAKVNLTIGTRQYHGCGNSVHSSRKPCGAARGLGSYGCCIRCARCLW